MTVYAFVLNKNFIYEMYEKNGIKTFCFGYLDMYVCKKILKLTSMTQVLEISPVVYI